MRVKLTRTSMIYPKPLGKSNLAYENNESMYALSFAAFLCSSVSSLLILNDGRCQEGKNESQELVRFESTISLDFSWSLLDWPLSTVLENPEAAVILALANLR
jgi:hypothetical protein